MHQVVGAAGVAAAGQLDDGTASVLTAGADTLEDTGVVGTLAIEQIEFTGAELHSGTALPCRFPKGWDVFKAEWNLPLFLKTV
jgi:hypothetical protein